MVRSAGDLRAAGRQRQKFLGSTQAELATRSAAGKRFIVEHKSGKPSCQLEKSLIVAHSVGVEAGGLMTARLRGPYATTISISDRPSVTVDDKNLL